MEQTNSQRAYDYLRKKLIAGELAPGTRIRYGPAGKELGISATPVREAIGRLANEGFVKLVPQLGAVVRHVGREELIEFYEMREALEPYAAARAAERIDKPQLDEIRQQFECMKSLAEQIAKSGEKTVGKSVIKQFQQADLAFHLLIIAAMGNQTMVRTVGNSHVFVRVISTDRHSYDATVMAMTCEDHHRILTALEQGVPEAAREAMSMHIHNSLERTLASDAARAEHWSEN